MTVQITDEEKQIVQNILTKYAPDCAVWVFGSRAKNTASKYSDLDLALVGNKPLSLQKMADLNEAFSESDLIWKVDIIDYLNTSDEFRKIIDKDKTVLK
ncbi:MAG: nucleotidyltransferase domain-containing protein [Cardiobacteriaceae bacterium]|nr:nucleotidyltransferase domain-containing protein [Cardiobacteriaceae bacterium]